MTNIGIVLPEPGYHDALRELTREHGHAADHRRDAHAVRRTGRLHRARRAGARHRDHRQGHRRRDPGRRVRDDRGGGRRGCAGSVELEDIDVGGIGGTLAGQRAVAGRDARHAERGAHRRGLRRMLPLGERWADGVAGVLERRGMPWHVTRLGARAEYAFSPEQPRTGRRGGGLRRLRAPDAAAPVRAQPPAAADAVPQHGAHAPTTTEADVDRHTAAFDDVVSSLLA